MFYKMEAKIVLPIAITDLWQKNILFAYIYLSVKSISIQPQEWNASVLIKGLKSYTENKNSIKGLTPFI